MKIVDFFTKAWAVVKSIGRFIRDHWRALLGVLGGIIAVVASIFIVNKIKQAQLGKVVKPGQFVVDHKDQTLIQVKGADGYYIAVKLPNGVKNTDVVTVSEPTDVVDPAPIQIEVKNQTVDRKEIANEPENKPASTVAGGLVHTDSAPAQETKDAPVAPSRDGGNPAGGSAADWLGANNPNFKPSAGQ